MNYWLAIIFTTLLFSTAYADIVAVRVNWNTVQCKKDCATLLEKYFRKIHGVSGVSIDSKGGVATLEWKPGTRFNSEKVLEAFAFVGITMDSMQVTVSGTVTHTGKKYYLTSNGDGTRFHLLGNVDTSKNRYEATTSPYNRTLTADQKERLESLEKDKATVTISGLILEAHQFPPLDLIVGDIKSN